MNRHIYIEAVRPTVDGGRYPAKRIAGQPVHVEADVIRDGHEALHAVVKWRRKRDRRFSEAPMHLVVNDRWEGTFTPQENTRYVFTIEAWTDVYTSWLVDLRKRVDVNDSVSSEVVEGRHLLESLLDKAGKRDKRVLERAIEGLRTWDGPPADALAIAADERLQQVVAHLWPRTDAASHEPELELIVDRPLAQFSAWYEMFPRSYGKVPGKHGTFREAEQRLPAIRDLGFDIVYLPPIHPVGTTHRKGRNNALTAEADDPGSPWAIGAAAGGHDAVEPRLGTIEDFDHFVHTAENLGLEVALDFAIQCSPDHPWVKEHPEWFHHRPDGTIKYAENPPKKYQDVYPVNFDTRNWKALWNTLRDVVWFWVEHGVKVFRVDNPHTKPFAFWHWLIEDIQRRRPDVLFLAEAFTRPKVMRLLAKVGFTQSYTYFTWRNHRAELTEYLNELAHTEMADYYRPNFWPNTPDILPEVLQHGGRPAFKMRLVLAATMAPNYGIYSGYELCENEALPGREEYRNSEKYEVKVRDWNAAGNINEFIAHVNRIRRENPALHTLENIRFLPTNNEQLIAYARHNPAAESTLIVVVNMDPHMAHYGNVHVPAEAVGVGHGQAYVVHDLLTGAHYTWGLDNYVHLAPEVEPAHILRVERRGV